MTPEPTPENGVRFTLELQRSAPNGPYAYRGAARIAEQELALNVTVSVDGETVTVTGAAPPAADELHQKLAKLALALVRTAVRSAVVRGQAVPRRVQRWRAL